VKKIADIILHLPRWCAVAVALYGVLFAEFTYMLNQYVQVDAAILSLFQTITRIGYFVTLLFSIIAYLIMSLMFHLMALLFDGRGKFWHFAIGCAFPYIVPAAMILISLFILSNLQITPAADAATIMAINPTLGLATKIINISFIPYYLIVVVLVRYCYSIRWLQALASVAMPASAVWGIAEIVKLF
jgi:hypothetical protein